MRSYGDSGLDSIASYVQGDAVCKVRKSLFIMKVERYSADTVIM